MERETTTQDDDQNPSTKIEPPPRKQPGSGVPGGSGGGGDRLKRDEWSEGAVMTLLEAYESKWILRNRAKLKGQDWEDVAKCVSSRSSNTKSPKTQTQCKNKIESMKKRYRSECASADTSSWPLFSRLHRLLRGSGAVVSSHASLPAQPPPLLLELSPVALTCLPPQPPSVEMADNSHESNDVEPIVKENEEIAEKTSDKKNNNNDEQHEQHETDDSGSSTPALYSNDQKGNISLRSRKRKRRRRDDSSGSWEDVAESIRCVANAVVRSEQARMETMKEVERMRVEAEVKRGEMELQRTQIIADTQLEIARLFASAIGKNVDDSLKIGKS